MIKVITIPVCHRCRSNSCVQKFPTYFSFKIFLKVFYYISLSNFQIEADENFCTYDGVEENSSNEKLLP